MKKSLVAILLVIFACLICLSACEEPEQEVMTAEKWEEILGNPIPNTNVTIKIDDASVAKLDLSHKKILLINTQSDGTVKEEYYSVENDEFYSYTKNNEGEWEKRHLDKVDDDPLGAKSLVETLKSHISTYWQFYSFFKDKYELFTFDEQLQQYTAENISFIYLNYITVTCEKAVYRFDDSFRPVYMEMQFDRLSDETFEFTDYDTTKVTLPPKYTII